MEGKIVETAKIGVNSGKCVGVYDKKLLWRAQLYIDETLNADGTASGNVDWNNANRWTFAQGNEWDKDWFDSDNDGIIDEAGPYNGGQCEIKPWTSIYTYFPAFEAWAINNNYPIEVHNAVPYSMGCDDPPYFFNQDMVEQKDAIQTYYNINNNTQVTPNPAPATNRAWANWNDTQPPDDEWGNYIRANPEVQNTPYSIAAGDQTIYYPYTPGFSSFRTLFNKANDPTQTGIPDLSPGYYFTHTQYSAGVECQGLITRAAGYEGNIYTANSPGEEERTTWTHGTGDGIIGIGNWLNAGWLIEDAINTDRTSLIIPGDIIEINGYAHIVMINKINYDENRVALWNQVYLIEAFGGSMTVYNERNWEDLRDETQNETYCNIIRLGM